jgi:hypothetical protein
MRQSRITATTAFHLVILYWKGFPYRWGILPSSNLRRVYLSVATFATWRRNQERSPMKRLLSFLVLSAALFIGLVGSAAPAMARESTIMRDVGIGVSSGLAVVEYDRNREDIHEAIGNAISNSIERGKANAIRECARRTAYGGCQGIGDLNYSNRG